MEFRTRAIHVANQPNDGEHHAVVPPLYLASTFAQPSPGVWREFDYSRSGNPTRAAFESTMADLESGRGGLAFSSGMAAIHCVTMLLEAGDHVLASSDIYGGTYRLLHNVCSRSGIRTSLVDTRDPAAIEAAITPRTKLLWIESPGNPLMSITDIAQCADIARQHDVLLGVDSTFATPVLTRPLELGADIVMHSATKYIGGHSDALGGVLVVRRKDLLDRLYFLQNAAGAVMGPLEAYLCSRGLKTLELRVREQCRTAQQLAEWLAQHPSVKQVRYPGLPGHPEHAIARRQMDGGFGAMISFEVGDNVATASCVARSTKLFQLAVSLGAVESLIEQPAAMSHCSYAAEDRRANGICDGLLRISVGLEAFEDLRDDLAQAIASSVPQAKSCCA